MGLRGLGKFKYSITSSEIEPATFGLVVQRLRQYDINKQTNKQIPWSESVSEIYRPSDRRPSTKPMPTSTDRERHVISMTNPHGRTLGPLDHNQYDIHTYSTGGTRPAANHNDSSSYRTNYSTFNTWDRRQLTPRGVFGTSSNRSRTINIKKKLHGLSPRANYTDRATAACRRSDCQLLRIEGAT
jgi:hypothetical protein